MKEIIINIDSYNENSIKTIEGDNLSEVYKIYICKNKRRVNLTNKIAIMAYVNEYGSKKSNILALNITNASQGEIELPITNVISNENGVYACQIAIYGENNSLEQTAPFSLIVENNIFSKISNTAINSSDFHILSEAIKTANEYSEKLKEGTENIELQYADKLSEVNSQLSNISNNENVKGTKSLVTFIADDGDVADYTKYRDFCKRMNIKTGLAIIPEVINQPNFLTLDQLKELVSDGHYVLGHGLTKLTNLTLENVENNFKNCIELGRRIGQKITQYAYPEGASNPDIRRLLRRYFEAGYRTGNKYNVTPIDTTLINRPMLGSYEIPELNTLEGFKKVIDSAFDNNAWVVFCMHSGSTTEQRWRDLEELINYIRSKNIDIVTPEVGFKLYKNVVDIIDEDNNSGFRIGNDGTAYSDTIKDSKVIVREYSGIKSDTPLTSEKFKYGYKTIDSFVFSDNSGFPSGAGTLETFKPKQTFDIGCGYQKWIPYGKNYVQIRSWLPISKRWGEFSKIENNPIVIEKINNRTGNDLISSFPKGIIYTPISANFSSANGFPSSRGGMLVTENIYTENGFQRQYFKVYNTKVEMVRYTTDTGSWGDWDSVARIKKGFTTINGFSIGANKTVEKTVNLSGIELSSCICAVPDLVLEQGIMWSCYVSAVGVITIRFFNTTNSEKTLNSRLWRFSAVN